MGEPIRLTYRTQRSDLIVSRPPEKSRTRVWAGSGVVGSWCLVFSDLFSFYKGMTCAGIEERGCGAPIEGEMEE